MIIQNKLESTLNPSDFFVHVVEKHGLQILANSTTRNPCHEKKTNFHYFNLLSDHRDEFLLRGKFATIANS